MMWQPLLDRAVIWTLRAFAIAVGLVLFVALLALVSP